jgi:hypothetical protein
VRVRDVLDVFGRVWGRLFVQRRHLEAGSSIGLGVSRNLALLVQFKQPVPKVSTWLAVDKGNIGGATISSKRGWTAGASTRDRFSVSIT